MAGWYGTNGCVEPLYEDDLEFPRADDPETEKELPFGNEEDDSGSRPILARDPTLDAAWKALAEYLEGALETVEAAMEGRSLETCAHCGQVIPKDRP